MLYCYMETRPSLLTTKETFGAHQKETHPFSSLAETFPQFNIEHDDLMQLGFDIDEIAQLSSHDLAVIAQTMREHLIHEWLPQELRSHITNRLYNQE